MKVGQLAIALKMDPPRIVQVTHVQGRMVLVAWLDSLTKTSKLRQGSFWAHQLDFDVDRVRALAREQLVGK